MIRRTIILVLAVGLAGCEQAFETHIGLSKQGDATDYWLVHSTAHTDPKPIALFFGAESDAALCTTTAAELQDLTPATRYQCIPAQ